MSTPNKIGNGIWINPKVVFGENVTVGHASCVGYDLLDEQTQTLGTIIGSNVKIGAFCVISLGAKIGDNVELDHYCRIDLGSEIGNNTKILYSVQIFENVKIGENCIIGGDLIDRAVVEDNVTYMGHMAHSYRNPGSIQDWDTMIQPSPIIRHNSVVGERAMIIGGVSIGPESYIAAGEIVRTNIPPRSVLYKGKLMPIENWRGLLSTRK